LLVPPVGPVENRRPPAQNEARPPAVAAINQPVIVQGELCEFIFGFIG
jgi:hypothetical protein